jgi:O-antigen ligase
MTHFVASNTLLEHDQPDANTVIRTVLFLAVLSLMWVSLHPYSSLEDAPAPTSDGGDKLNQVVFSGIFLVFLAWTYFNKPEGLRLLLRPALVVMLTWFVISIVFSWEPALALRRFVFAVIVLTLSGITLLLPKNLRHFSDLIAVAALALLALCYFGVVFFPVNAIHQATDFLEPEHAGSWRGVFAHKNQAASMMVMLFFIGLFVARARSLRLGALIIVLSLVFLVFTRSKTPIGMFPLAMIVAAVVTNVRRPMMGIVVALGIGVALNLLTVGSVYIDPIRQVLDAVMSDSSFTGRTDIWKFAIGELGARLITGYGFGAFWGTEHVVFGLSGSGTWAIAATDAHNSYLNIALTTGIPGLLLACIWFAVLPLADYYRIQDDGNVQLLATLFVQILIYGLYVSAVEGMMFAQGGEIWFSFMLAVFGLRYISAARVRS